jgi:hypothetical protein
VISRESKSRKSRELKERQRSARERTSGRRCEIDQKRKRVRHATNEEEKYILLRQRLKKKRKRNPGKGGGFKMKRKRPRISGGIGSIGAQQWHSGTVRRDTMNCETQSGSQGSSGSLQSGTQGPIKEENRRGSIAETGLSLVFQWLNQRPFSLVSWGIEKEQETQSRGSLMISCLC